MANVLFFPMIYLSGLFPIGMPKALQAAAVIWPAFHVHQLSLAALGLETTQSATVTLVVLVVFTATLVTIAARRLARVG